jgi:hypothetical protein
MLPSAHFQEYISIFSDQFVNNKRMGVKIILISLVKSYYCQRMIIIPASNLAALNWPARHMKYFIIVFSELAYYNVLL